MSRNDPAGEKLDTVYRCIADSRRRQILAYLRNMGGDGAAVDDVVTHLVNHEEDSPRSDRESIAVDLHHVQLPILDDAGVIEFDSQTERVSYTNRDAVDAVLDAHESIDRGMGALVS